MDRKLIEYLPVYLRQYREIQVIMGVEQVDFDEFWQCVADVYDDQFIHSLTGYGVDRWERMLGITPPPDSTLDERKFKILAMLNFTLPYTYRRLQEILTSLVGANNFRTALYHGEYRLIVKLALESERSFNDVAEMLDNVCPANLILNVYMFNTHKLLRPFTHSELAVYTHEGVRTEILT